MRMTVIRPLILIVIFFAGLFTLREPIRHFDDNLAVLGSAYIVPSAMYLKEVVLSIFPGGNDTPEGQKDGDTGGAEVSAHDIPSLDASSTTPTLTPPTDGGKAVIAKDISQTVDSTRLSIAGIFSQTNFERSHKNIATLRLNTKLNLSAEKKLQDMFSNQYFEHVSPSGVSVSDLVRDSEYEYIVVGENLALGNFGGDLQVVQAWMNSPGHRANILDPRFSEIGIAVGKGLYDGKELWIAVQHFAKPLASCEGPRAELKTRIATETEALSVFETKLKSTKSKIDEMMIFSVEYSQLVETYNREVSEYNARLEGLKDEIAIYNLQVRRFNTCAGIANPQS